MKLAFVTGLGGEKMKRNSCETCALMASLPQVEKEDDLRGEKIYAEKIKSHY
jgi:hypothetical protein